MTIFAKTLLTASEIDAHVQRLAREISAACPDGVVLIGVLKSAVLPLADISRALTVHATIDLLALSAYAPESGRVQFRKDLDTDIGGRDVVLLTTLVDTGLRVAFLQQELARRKPASFYTATMFDKVGRRILPVPLDFVGAQVPNEYLIGYGLDYEGRYRNVSELAIADLEALDADPNVYAHQYYRV